MSDPTSDPRDDGATDQRHIRIGRGAWRAAATRARADGRGLTELVTALADAYGAGAIVLPPAAVDDDGTTVRHARIGRAAWHAAAGAARRDRTAPADAVARLVTAYGSGTLAAPAAADRTGVRPLPRESNGCSIDPADGSLNIQPVELTTHHHQNTPTTPEEA